MSLLPLANKRKRTRPSQRRPNQPRAVSSVEAPLPASLTRPRLQLIVERRQGPYNEQFAVHTEEFGFRVRYDPRRDPEFHRISRLSPNQQAIERGQHLTRLLADAMIEIQLFVERESGADDFVQLRLESDSLPRGPVVTNIVRARVFDAQAIYLQVAAALNSNEEVNVEDPSLRFIVERVPMGGGAGKRKSVFDRVSSQTLQLPLRDFLRRNRICASVPEDMLPGYCAIGALLLGLKHLQGQLKGNLRDHLFGSKAKCEAFKRDILNFANARYNKSQNRVLANADGRTAEQPVNLEEFEKLVKYNTPQVVPEDVGVIVMQRERHDAIILRIRPQAARLIFLLQVDHHMVFVKNISTLVGKPQGFWCPSCEEVVVCLNKHICSSREACPCCKCRCDGNRRVAGENAPSLDAEKRVYCQSCGREFLNQTCYNNHLKVGLSRIPRFSKDSICHQIRACVVCQKDLAAKQGVLVKNKKGRYLDAYKRDLGHRGEHHCWMAICWQCKARYDTRSVHQCLVQVLDQPTLTQRNEKEGCYVYYDIETMVVPHYQHDPARPGCVTVTNKFIPNLFCFQFVGKARPIQQFTMTGSDCIRCQNYTGTKTVVDYLDNICDNPRCLGRLCCFCPDFKKEYAQPTCHRPNCHFGCAKCRVQCHCRLPVEYEWVEKDCLVEGCRSVALEQTMNFLFFGKDSVLATGQPHRFVGHNASGFDALVILAEYLRNTTVKPDVIADGTRLKSIRVGQCVFLDSRLFIPGSLEKMAHDFKLPVSKGHFPHRFNTYEHQNYAGPLPALEWFKNEWEPLEHIPAKLQTWHAEESQRLRDTGTSWHFSSELQRYCQQDVSVLRRAFELFRHEVFAETGIMPGNGNVTTAGCANDIWRSRHLSPGTVGIVPEMGFPDRQQSNVAIQFLKYCDAIYYGGLLQFPAKDGHSEKKVLVEIAVDTPVLPGPSIKAQEEYVPRITKKFKLDGYYEDSFESGIQRTAVEFYGCYYHGCPRCFRGNTPSPLAGGKTMHQLYMDTLEREQHLQEAGFDLHTMWECQWYRMSRRDPFTRQHLQELDLFHLTAGEPTPSRFPLNEETDDEEDLLQPTSTHPQTRHTILPRQALFGGRTLTMAMYASVADHPPGTIIKYYDVNSLYPFVMRTHEYPVGQPVIYTEHLSMELDAYFGLAYAQVLPPRDLLHPVLPRRVQEKLCFPLCAACADEGNFTIQGCTHEDPQQRALEGTFTTMELYAAMRLGYTLLRLDEVWHWPQRSTELFKSYVDTFFRLKQESSGWPQGVQTESQKRDYVQQIFEETGLTLRAEKIGVNPTRRMVSKLLLNSLWGGFVKNPWKRVQKDFFVEAKDFWDWLNDETLDEKNFKILSQRIILATSRKNQAFQHHDGKGNMVHGIFTTAHARLHLLHSALLVKGRSVLYMDTDSVLVLETPQVQTTPPLDIDDTRLGKWKDELPPKPHPETGVMTPRYICDFVSGGPKNYSYVVAWAHADGSIPPYHERQVESTKCVVRGFRRDDDAVTFEVMRQCVLDCGTWAKASPQKQQDLLRQGWTVSASGITQRPEKIETQRFTVVKGSRKPLKGVRQDGKITAYFEETLQSHFGLAPGLLKRAYALVNDKVITDFKGELDRPYLCYPFGYVKPREPPKKQSKKTIKA